MSGTVLSLLPVLMILGAVAGFVGGLAPWIPHQAAGLTVGGFYLFEATKFFPAVRSGAFPLLREGFLLPVLISAVLISLIPALLDMPRSAARWLFLFAAAIVALSALPSYPAILTAHHDPEYRGQLLLAGGTLLLSLVSPLAWRLPARLVAALESVLAGVGLLLPILQFLRVRPLFEDLYHAPVGAGWGLVIYALGFGAVLVGGIWWACLPCISRAWGAGSEKRSR